MGREGVIEQATLYYKNAIELAKKAGNNRTAGVISLSECYVKKGRIDEAMDLCKSRCDEIGKESMDPGIIIAFAKLLQDHHETSHALEILEEH